MEFSTDPDQLIETVTAGSLTLSEAIERFEISEIIRRFGQWVVTQRGVESLVIGYSIDKNRLDETDWVAHMREKKWVVIDEFEAALKFAQEYYLIKPKTIPEIEIITENQELASICELYWEVDTNLDFVYKVGELAEIAQIDKAKLTSVVREACHAYVSDWECSNCGKPLVFSGRTDFTANRPYLLNGSYHQRSFLCSECEKRRRDREIEARKLQEETARKAREAVEIELQKKIRESYNLTAREPIDVQSLSFTDAVYLISLMRGGAYENLTKIMPVSMFEQPLAADREFSTEIINHLYQNRLIYVHPDNEPEAFVDDDISRFYIYRAYYAPPLTRSAPEDPKRLMTELISLVDAEWSEKWCEEALSIWKKVALSECKEYLLFVLDEHHFEFSPSEKTTQYLEFALEHYSTAQVYNTIWRAAKDAAAYYQREGISKRQAANAAIA